MVMEAQDTKIMPGYKLTEVGVIPEDWIVRTLQSLTSEIGDGIHSTPDYVKTSDFFFINGNNLFNDKIRITDETKCVSEREFYKYKKELNKGTILLSINGTIGNIAFFNDENVILGKSAAYINVKNSVDKKFVSYLLQSTTTKNFFKNELTGSTINNLSLESIRNIPIPLPPTKSEQQAISTALSDVDALIALLDKLIAKKRDIKQATMQQLLTGKTRLPGFSGEWEMKKLEEMLRVRHGKSQQGVVVDDGEYPILATGGEIGRTNDCLYSKPSVLIGRKGTIDTPQYMDTPFWTIDTLFYTEIFEHIHPKFVFYLFHMIDWLRYNEASGVPSLNASTIECIEVQCPLFPEQQAIATVLSDMDNEIAALEQKRAKTRMVKQGMMQELLTGKTRLV